VEGLRVRLTRDINPYRDGSRSHAYIEIARKAKTFGQFKTKFKPGKLRLNACVGLHIAVRAGHARIG
jgi:hypothetical protein